MPLAQVFTRPLDCCRHAWLTAVLYAGKRFQQIYTSSPTENAYKPYDAIKYQNVTTAQLVSLLKTAGVQSLVDKDMVLETFSSTDLTELPSSVLFDVKL